MTRGGAQKGVRLWAKGRPCQGSGEGAPGGPSPHGAVAKAATSTALRSSLVGKVSSVDGIVVPNTQHGSSVSALSARCLQSELGLVWSPALGQQPGPARLSSPPKGPRRGLQLRLSAPFHVWKPDHLASKEDIRLTL